MVGESRGMAHVQPDRASDFYIGNLGMPRPARLSRLDRWLEQASRGGGEDLRPVLGDADGVLALG